MKLQPADEHPHGLSDTDYDSIFTTGKHIIFAFHGYPWLIHRLTYCRANRDLHVCDASAGPTEDLPARPAATPV
jgi:xylulose-5-phosphate/fructose-6-phosphate phosphoketolase